MKGKLYCTHPDNWTLKQEQISFIKENVFVLGYRSYLLDWYDCGKHYWVDPNEIHFDLYGSDLN